MEYKKSRWEMEYDKYNKDKDELKSKMAAIKRELAELKEGAEYAAKKKELKEMEKTQVKYDRIEKNKDKIENVLKFKKDLVGRTVELVEKKTEIEKYEKVLKTFEQKIEKLDNENQRLLNRVRQIDNELKNPNLKEADRVKLQEERKEKVNAAKENNTKYSEVANKKDAVGKKLETFDKDKISEELLKNEKLLGKCDLIGANLLKGKNMEEISAKLENFEFKPNKDFAKKIQEMREMYAKEKEAEKEEPEVEQPEPEVGQSESGYPTKVNKFSQWFSKLKENIKEKGFVKGVIDSFRKEEPETEQPETEEPDIEESETEQQSKTNDDFEYAMKHLSGKNQDKVLEEIAKNGTSGFRESMKVSQKERLENIRRQSARQYAEKYGGRYKTQDGADLDK